MTATDGTKIDPLTTSYYRFYSDYIWPTHILNSSCFELIFTNQANVVIESGVHPNCHHQLFL